MAKFSLKERAGQAWRSAASWAGGALRAPRPERRSCEPEPEWEPFLRACEKGKADADLMTGIEAGWHKSAWSDEGHCAPTPLHLAALAPDLSALMALLQAGAPVDRLDARNWSALGAAAEDEEAQLAALEELLKHGASLSPRGGEPALGCACEGGRLDAMELLIERQPRDWRGKFPRALASWGLWSASFGRAQASREACVKRMLELGGDPNATRHSGDSALLRAGDRGDAGAIRALLDAGANPCFRRPWDHATVFMWAARNLAEDPRGPLLILERGGAASGERKDKRTALMFAAHGGMIECLEAALAAGGDVNAQDDEGATALHFAVIAESAECVRRLLAAGANPDIGQKPGLGRTAMGRAAFAGHEELFKELALAGADPLGPMDTDLNNASAMRDSAFARACVNEWTELLLLTWDRGLARRRALGQEAFLLALADEQNPSVGAALRAALEMGELEREIGRSGLSSGWRGL